MPPIPVLHLITSMCTGGAERQLLTLLEAFDRERFEHHLGVLRPGGELEAEIDIPGLRLAQFGFRYRRLLPAMRSLGAYLRHHEIQILHCHLHFAAVYGRLAATGAGTPVTLFTEHSDVTARPVFWRLVERWQRRRTSRKIAVSEAQRQASIRLEGYASDAVITIPNSIPVGRFASDPGLRADARRQLGYAPEDLVVGNIANHTDQKRLDRLIDAFAEITPRHPGLRLLLVGDGPLHEDLIARTRDRGLTGRVRFTGRRSDVSRLLPAMDLFAISSRWEGMPINLLEAMAASLPVVATDVGGVADVLEHEVTGLLVAASGEGLASAIESVLSDADRRTRMGRAARARVEAHHDSAINAHRIELLWLELLERAGHPPPEGA